MPTPIWETGELANRGTIQEIVRIYEAELQNIRTAYHTLHDSAEKLTNALGNPAKWMGIRTLPSTCSEPLRVLADVEIEIRATAWRTLIDRLGVRKILSLSRNKELSEKLHDPKNLPDLTVETIFEMFQLLVGNTEVFAREAITEVYEALHITPNRETWYPKQHKTNLKNAVEDLGNKIILTHCVGPHYGTTGFKVNYGRCVDTLTALDKVFHILDGEPFNDSGYTCPLVDAVNTAPDGKGETEYFKFKAYQNGNLHIEFKHLDLLKEFNKIANDGTALKSGTIFK